MPAFSSGEAMEKLGIFFCLESGNRVNAVSQKPKAA